MLLFDRRRQRDLACAARRSKAAWSRSRLPASEAPREAARLRLATVRGAIHPRACLGRRVRRACSSARLRARLHPARVQARTIPGASRARPPWLRPARHGGRRPRPAPSTPERFDLLEQEGVPRRARSGAPRACSSRGCAFDLRRQRRDICVARGALGPRERRACRRRPQASHRDPRNHQLVGGPRRGWSGWGRARRACARPRRGGRSGAGAGPRDCAHARHFTVAVHFERRPRCVERLRRPSEVARDRAISASATIHLARATASFRTEPARRSSQESLRSNEIAELRHRDASQREGGRRHAGRPGSGRRGDHPGERTRRGRDQRVHRDPATLVTPAFR